MGLYSIARPITEEGGGNYRGGTAQLAVLWLMREEPDFLLFVAECGYAWSVCLSPLWINERGKTNQKPNKGLATRSELLAELETAVRPSRW